MNYEWGKQNGQDNDGIESKQSKAVTIENI